MEEVPVGPVKPRYIAHFVTKRVIQRLNDTRRTFARARPVECDPASVT